MLYFDYTKELTGLQGIIIENIERNDLTTTIHIKMERKLTKCPCCGELTDTIHDYRTQLVKDTPAFGNNVILSLKKRRYRCLHCNKRFIEDISFLPKYYRMTNRLTMYILDKLGEERSFSSVAHEVQLSVSTVIRVFDLVSYIAPKSLPTVIAIDEFKGNTGDEEYLGHKESEPNIDLIRSIDVMNSFLPNVKSHRRSKAPISIRFCAGMGEHEKDISIIPVKPGEEQTVSKFVCDKVGDGKCEIVIFLLEDKKQIKALDVDCNAKYALIDKNGVSLYTLK